MAKIEKIVLNIGKKTVELTVDEARQLRGILAELFGADRVEYHTRDIHHYRDPYKIYPYWYGNSSGTAISLTTGDAPTQSDTSNWLEEIKAKFTA